MNPAFSCSGSRLFMLRFRSAFLRLVFSRYFLCSYFRGYLHVRSMRAGEMFSTTACISPLEITVRLSYCQSFSAETAEHEAIGRRSFSGLPGPTKGCAAGRISAAGRAAAQTKDAMERSTKRTLALAGEIRCDPAKRSSHSQRCDFCSPLFVRFT